MGTIFITLGDGMVGWLLWIEKIEKRRKETPALNA